MTDSDTHPSVRVGIVLPEDHVTDISLTLPDIRYAVDNTPVRAARLRVRCDGASVTIEGAKPSPKRQRGVPVTIVPQYDTIVTGVTLHGVRAGRGFHWSTDIDVVLPGAIEISAEGGCLQIVDELDVETYLKGVITAEMSGDAPREFLKAQCIVARSWMSAATERKHGNLNFDFCNDDCCQRYQGIGNLTPSARTAVDETSGQVMIHKTGVIVDANYSKSCGGIVEAPEHVWSAPKPGQRCVVDAPSPSPLRDFEPVGPHNIGEYVAGAWLARCDAYCCPNVVSDADLPRYLGRVDDGCGHFRWSVTYAPDELTDLLRRNFFDRAARTGDSRIDRLYDLVVTRRGRSGRAITLDVVYDDPRGRRRTATIEDQYWIRHALHESFLYSSAFDVRMDRDDSGWPRRIELAGAGWGHGAGMCQIGALGMAIRGHDHRAILNHYFDAVSIQSGVNS